MNKTMQSKINRELNTGFKDYFVNNFGIVLGRLLMSNLRNAPHSMTYMNKKIDKFYSLWNGHI